MTSNRSGQVMSLEINYLNYPLRVIFLTFFTCDYKFKIKVVLFHAEEKMQVINYQALGELFIRFVLSFLGGRKA